MKSEEQIKLSLFQKLNNKITTNKVMNQLDQILNEEAIQKYYSSHKWIDDEYIRKYIKENESLEKQEIFSLYFATQYFKRTYQKEPNLDQLSEEEKRKVFKYFFLIHKNFEKYFHILETNWKEDDKW